MLLFCHKSVLCCDRPEKDENKTITKTETYTSRDCTITNPIALRDY